MSERPSFLFQARLGRSPSLYPRCTPQSEEVMASKLPKIHLGSMLLSNASMPDSSGKPAIPPRSPSRPRPRNKLQKKRNLNEEKSHIGYLMKDAGDAKECHSRGTLGGFWVLGQDAKPTSRRTSSWYYESTPDLRPLSITVHDANTCDPDKSWHQRNLSSSSGESDLSSPFSAVDSPSWDSDNTSASSIYSDDAIERVKTPGDFTNLLNSAEILAEQYRALLASRASMRTPAPPPVPPKDINRGRVRPVEQQHERLVKQQASSIFEQDCGPKPKTLRRVISQHSLRRMTMSSHPALSGSSPSSPSSSAFQLCDSYSCSSTSTESTSPPPHYSAISTLPNNDSTALSRSVHNLTYQLSSALLRQDFCSPSDSMQNLNRNRKSMIQIQNLIDAYEELQEELEMGRVNDGERTMVWEMNGVVESWLDGLYRKNGAYVDPRLS